MPPRKRLGQLLTELKIIDEHQLQSALGHQKQWGGKLGTILIQKGFCKEDQVVTALSQHLAMPAVRLADAKIDPRAVKTVSKTVAEKLHVFAYEVTGSGRSEVITIAMSDPTDLSAVDQLAFHTGKRIKPMLAGDSEVVAAIQQYYASDKPKEQAPPSVPPGSRPLVSPLAGGKPAAPGLAARLTPSAPMPAVAAPGGAPMATPLLVKRAQPARPPSSASIPVAAPPAAHATNGAAAPMEPVGIEGDDLPPDAPMEGLEPIAAHTQGGQSVEGSEEVAGQGAAGDAVTGLEAVNPREEVESVEVQKMDELEPAVRPQEAGPAPADSSAAEAPPLEDQAALQGWAEVQKEGVDLHTENPAPPPPAEGGWSQAPAEWGAAPAEPAGDALADELPMDAIMGTADVLEGGAEEPAAEAPAAWNEVADPLAATPIEAEAPEPAPAAPPGPPAGAPAGWSEPSAAEAEAESAWGGSAESSWDPSPPPAEEPSPEQPAPEQEWAERAAAEVQAAAEETAADSWGAPEPSMESPEEAAVAAAEDVPPEQQAAEETYVESATTQEFAVAEPPAAAEGGSFEESPAEEAAAETAVAEESPAPGSWSGGEEQESEQQPIQGEGWAAPPTEPEQEGTGWFGEALAATSPLSPADLGTLAALGLDPADGVGALRFLACLVRVLNRHASIDAEELAAEIRESRIAGVAAAQEMEQGEAQPAYGAEQAADAPSEAAGSDQSQEESGTARDPWTGSHES